ncbi:uncharacterized protein LOC128555607 [Mercenaria mercenaria]|uniref:uncharacterized protein LOC128555607 n=1 Tax=Mercenaria mercenaria TaxID=6596 RepID=UPI00234EF7FE|nr:uncharacterized protein LOC128555607 [Mercenaria mercenaria]
MFEYILNTSTCQMLGNHSAVQGLVPSIEMHETLLLVTGFGLFTTLIALLFVCIRRRIYKDKNTLDTAFDAGGKVSVGLTATTIVSQWTWAATLLYSCTVASKYGISGPFWYAAGATIQILLFAMVSVQLKVRAPGAKTFLQVIRARYGATTHKVFVFYALLTNIIVTANSMLGGSAVLSGLTKDMDVEYATMLMTTVIGTYTLIGGLGATFYVSFFNTAMICIMMLVFVLRVYDDPDNDGNPLGSEQNVYDYIACSQGPEGNRENSYLTLMSKSGFMFGMITIAAGFGTSYVDQSYWQSSVAAKPRQGVLGFLAGGLVWFSIPFALATTMGLAYISLSAHQNKPLLAEEDVDIGLVLPVVAQRMFGRAGEMMMIVMILMAVVSTGSAEVVAVTSIIVYDIHQLYLKPYRLVHDANSCILCGRGRGRKANVRDKCTCESMTVCSECTQDNRQRSQSKRALKPPYQCRTHGSFREYTDYLLRIKNWCLLWTTLGIVPLTILLYTLRINLTVVHMFMGVTINSAVIPIVLSMFWERLTGLGMITGSIGGSVLGLISWLSATASYPGGLQNFKLNAIREVPSLTGNWVSLLTGGIIAVLVSLFSLRSKEGSEVWEKTRDIDSPLSPWTELYQKDLNIAGAYRLDNRPSLKDVHKAFNGAKYVAFVGSITLTIMLVVIWPCIMVGVSVMSFDSFNQWVTVSKIWAFLAAIFIITAPFATEIWDIYKAFFRNVRIKTFPEGANTSSNCDDTVKDYNEDNGKKDTGVKLTDVENVHLSAFTPFRSRESDAGIISTKVNT